MKKTLLFSAVILAVLAYGCSSEDGQFGSEGIGRVILSPEIKSDVSSVVSRAVSGEDNLRESLVLWISNSNGPIRKYKGATSIPEKDWLPSGEYLAEAWAGDSVSATFNRDQRWFKGSARFSVTALQTTQVQIPCKIANVLVDMMFDSDLLDKLTDIKIVVGHSRGELEYSSNSGTGYFMMPSTDKNLSWTLTATRIEDGVAIKKTGVIKNAKGATRYTLVVHANVDDDEIGGAFFDLKVDTSMKPVYDYFTVEIPPVIEGYGFNPTDGVVFKEGEIGEQAIFITASADIVSAKLTLDGLSEYLGGITDLQGQPFNTLDFMTINDEIKAKVEAGGIDWEYNYYEEYESATLKINFREAFTDRLTEGEYDFIHEITDSANPPRTTNQTVNVRVSNDILNLQTPEAYDVWATKATITAVAMQNDYGTVGFEYRQEGSNDWTPVAAASAGDIDGRPGFLAHLTGLTPGTTYEYRVVSDLDNFVSKPLEFTTESALQLPNSGFESWRTGSDKALVPCAEGEDLFWDSGNHGSISLSVNVTTDTENPSHSGKSLTMRSQKVAVMGIGKFAAGNVFVGQYLATEGTDGQLGWGRPFASRPKALKVYVKYVPQAVTETSITDVKKKGDLDEGIIYIAILDDTMVSADADKYVDGVTQKQWPVIVKTKSSKRTLFDKNMPNVIAYGELVFKEATSGEGLQEFTIPLDYFKENVKASNIMITCSASRYGDYFTGGEGSQMWIDDLELVY